MTRVDCHDRTVLVVDDEPDVADAYAMKLDGAYRTAVAYSGEAALERIDGDVAAVLLDRRMPDMHGDEVLTALRARGWDCPVIAITAVGPDLDILELDFDDYLCKPVDAETLRTTLDQHIASRRIDPRLDEFLGILSTLAVLDADRTSGERGREAELARLRRRAGRLADELRDSVDDFDGLVETHRSLDRGSGPPL